LEPKKISETLLEKSISEKLDKLRIGNRYRNSDINKCRSRTDIEKYLENLSDNFSRGKGLLLVGPVGVGKTCSLIVLLKGILKRTARERVVTYTSDNKTEGTGQIGFASTLFATSNKIFNAVFRKDEVFLSALQNVQFLFIDDFGREYFSDFAWSSFEEMIDYRYSNKLCTFVTTNLTAKALAGNEKLGRVVDRWRECCDMIQISGESMRK